eukprot:898152-Pleurochrysis_carterae.AAC.1
MPALMQERELRKGSVRRCGAEGHQSHWPSTTGEDPAALSGVLPAMALDCNTVRGSNTGVGVSIGDNWSSSNVIAAGRVCRRLAR